LPASTETPEATPEEPTPVIEGTPLPFETIDQSEYGPGGDSAYASEQPWIEILQQAGDLEAIKGKISRDALELLRQVDFQSHIVVGVFQGLKPTDDYGVDILAVDRMEMRVSIYAEFIAPEPRMEARAIETVPYQLIKLDRKGLAGSRVFELIVEGTTILRVEVTVE
jgi:hypothetical protein